MRFSLNFSLFFSFFLFLLLQRSTHAIKKSYIVYLGGHSHGPEPSSHDFDRVTDAHHEFLGSFLRSKEKAKDAIFYSYTKHINAFSAMLEEEEAAEIAKNQEVVSIFLSKPRKLLTTRSWSFLGVENNGKVPSHSIWKKARFGEDTIIGNIDSGVWPESKSFSDEGMGPVPSRWQGICQQEEGVRCNRKLIGARYFSKGFASAAGQIKFNNISTVRDHDGHGTHTLSTAGGNFVTGANYIGYANGTAKGGSPKARVASYKPCWFPLNGNDSTTCNEADIIAAFDAAIADGVDVLSVSLGEDNRTYLVDGLTIGAFHAVQKGIVVVAAAGNSGPTYGSVSNVAPWIITVGASTTDRNILNVIELGNKKSLKGLGYFGKHLTTEKFYPLISGRQAAFANASSEEADFCKPGAIDVKKVEGKILVCKIFQEDEDFTSEGAVGVILVKWDKEFDFPIDLTITPALPISTLSYIEGETVFAYINSTKSPMAYISPVKDVVGFEPAPVMAKFSSIGPNNITPGILKPDITAPGVYILAANTQSELSDTPNLPYKLESGTSMSTPHVAGIVGLLKTLHPHWSPAAIRSAIMTTAFTQDNTMKPMLNSSNLKATPFNYGAGHIRPNWAIDPGLVYDLSPKDYLNFLCTIGYTKTQIKKISSNTYLCPKNVTSIADFNYPSITVLKLSGPTTITRIVKNVGTPRSTYKAHVEAPSGVSISMKPRKLKFKRIGEEKKFKLTLKAMGNGLGKDYVFGNLVWTDGKHHVRSPIVVKQAY